MMHCLSKKCVFMLCVVMLSIGCSSFLYAQDAPQQTTDFFTITKGDGLFTVIQNLYNQGFITHRVSFFVRLLLSGNAHRLLAGVYSFEKNNIAAIIDLFSHGPSTITVLIPPGITVHAVDTILARNNVIQKGLVENYSATNDTNVHGIVPNGASFEGVLMPDTYTFYYNQTATSVISQLSDHFLLQAHTACPQGVTYSQLIVASIVEKEVITLEDKKIVAGIIANRLKKDMPLQIDATSRYGVCGAQDECLFSSAQLNELDSAYNTYMYKGLPKGPIANVSVESLEAACNTTFTDYYYYVSSQKTKETYFSRTFAEHQKNIKKYLIQ